MLQEIITYQWASKDMPQLIGKLTIACQELLNEIACMREILNESADLYGLGVLATGQTGNSKESIESSKAEASTILLKITKELHGLSQFLG